MSNKGACDTLITLGHTYRHSYSWEAVGGGGGVGIRGRMCVCVGGLKAATIASSSISQ